MAIPFVARSLSIHATESARAAVYDALNVFDPIDKLEDDTGVIHYVGRKFDGDDAASKMIVIPALSLKRYGKPTKTDIRWLWKFFSGLEEGKRARWDDSSVLTMLWTTEPELYMMNPNVDIADWEQPLWVWAWIKYVHLQSKFAQRQGVLYHVLGEVVKENGNMLQEIKQLAKHMRKSDA